MSSERDQAKDSAGPFQCLLCPNGSVCLRWHQTLLLHFGREDVARILDCLEDISEATVSFVLPGRWALLRLPSRRRFLSSGMSGPGRSSPVERGSSGGSPPWPHLGQG